jgi:ABC-type proline/glycine betaine transport system permease subunit
MKKVLIAIAAVIIASLIGAMGFGVAYSLSTQARSWTGIVQTGGEVITQGFGFSTRLECEKWAENAVFTDRHSQDGGGHDTYMAECRLE